jgi:FtsP/CotA-like multicopper oxidase with cupredoxin domain
VAGGTLFAQVNAMHPHHRDGRGTALASILAITVAGGCGSPSNPSSTIDPSGRPLPPAAWDARVKAPEAVDRNPAPGVVEVDIEARIARLELVNAAPSSVWTYNGMLPGPLIRVPTGARLIVHFTNSLPEETTIHWHGIRLPANMDGVPEHSQPPVQPGGTFTYDFVVPDSGLFWYHPHVSSAQQVGDGLYGALLVEPRGTAAAAEEPAGLGDELVIVLSDIGVMEDGTLHDPAGGGDLGSLFGREGNIVLANGRVAPTVVARRGLRQRWRIVNSAKSRYFQLAMEGHRFVRIGGDGGLISAPVETERLVLTPGQRADVLVTPDGEPGAKVAVRWVPFDRGFGSTEYRPEENVLFVELTRDAPYVEDPIPTELRTLAPLEVRDTDLRRAISLTAATVDGKLVMGIDGVPSWEAEPLHARAGDTELWTLTNATEWDHPFHLHGFFFQPIDPTSGQPATPPEWKDTVNVPRSNGVVSFAVRYDDRSGMWMFHCHILDHADAGMMGMLHLAP